MHAHDQPGPNALRIAGLGADDTTFITILMWL